MHVRCGTDLTRVSRIRQAVTRGGDAFLRKVYSEAERQQVSLLGERRRMESLAVRFAAKEAVAKALGTGFGHRGVAPADIGILTNGWGAPEAVLTGPAARVLRELGVCSLSVSLSHEGDLALACCTVLCEGDGQSESGA